MNKKDIKIVFFGTPEFAVASLEKLVDSDFNIAAVVTMPDKVAGRGHKLLQSDVKKFALSRGLPVLQPEKLKSEEFLKQLREIDADLFIVIAFRMLPEAVWSMPRLGTFNLHGSLLPKYRGAAPINRAIMNGEKETGITTFFLKHEIDTGDIIDQQKITISDDDNVGSVYDRLMHLGAEMVVKNVEEIAAGTVKPKPQPEGEFIPAPKIFKSDCAIDWNRPAVEIHNQVRGLSPYPAAFGTIVENADHKYNAKIFTTALTEPKGCASAPGDIVIEGKRMWVKCSDKFLEIIELQPAGKKRMETSAFLLGYHPEKFVNTEF